MGNHRVASAAPRAVNANGHVNQHAAEATTSHSTNTQALALRNWPVSTRLIAVIVLALVMGLVFGGLRVASAADSAAQFGRVSQLAALGQQVTGLVQALENERDETAGLLPVSNPQALQRWYSATDAAAARVRPLAAGIGGSYPANIQSRVATMLAVINNHAELERTAQASQSVLSVIADYAAPINNMIALDDQIAQGTSDASLVNDVQTLNSLSLAKDQATQQRALLFNALTQKIFADGVQQALTTAESVELGDETAFKTTATPAEQSTYQGTVAGPSLNRAQEIEIYVQGLPLGTGALDIGQGALGFGANAAPTVWYAAQSGKVGDMQQVEQGIASSIVSRAQSLQSGASSSALFTAIVTVIILLLVLLATVVVARSLVGPLRKLREGALNIATVELPQRVRLLGEAPDASTSLEVAPIDVLSTDEIGQVARAFDQVHSEAVRLASNEASLRNSFNAMFVNLSRRSQSLIERLVRMIDSLEQNEGDPERLSNLFAMDHLVTRMRRNSENLLLLAGHESARKWSEPVSLADVARAAVSEIEQYSRVTLKIQPGIAVTGPAVSDVVHLLAEVIENATIFSAKDTPVHVAALELTSGGVLIEVSDNGVGVPEARLTEMNMRLDNPPVIDVSVSRHMGLFAVARLAERHGVRVRLRTKSPRGLIALVWLPDGVTERGITQSPWSVGRLGRSAGGQARTPGNGTHAAPAGLAMSNQTASSQTGTSQTGTSQTGTSQTGSSQTGSSQTGSSQTGSSQTGSSQTGNGWSALSASSPATTPMMPAPAASASREPAQAADSAVSDWFCSPRSSASGDDASSGAAAQADAGWQAGADEWAEGRHAAQIIADPVRGDHTAAGLPVRVPRANLIAGSAGGHRAGGATSRPADSRPGDGRGTQTAPAARAPRSPELARNRLSGFQRGTRRAKGQTPRAGEGADR